MNPELAPLARKLSYAMGQLDHFYLLNREKQSFELVGGFSGRHHSEAASTGDVQFTRLDAEDFGARASEIDACRSLCRSLRPPG